MIIATKYIRPNITIDEELVGLKKFYVYNYKGVHYRVFNSLINLRDFIAMEYKTWIFECETENELEKYLYQNTKFDTPSSSRHGFGKIYKENGKRKIKYNLQIRFIK